MEKKVITVKIKDGGAEKTFSIRLFGAMEGLDFMDKLFKSSESPSIKNIAGDLLPLASLVGPDGNVVDQMSMSKVDTYFQNPLAVLDLVIAIFRHQMVFMNESETFRGLTGQVEKLFNIPTSDSATQ